ncbi:MAG: hypothetical protein WBB67_08530 [bacterium]
MNEIMEILINHEEAISRLYEAYAQKFPDHKEFWSTLSWEEKDHAEQIRKLSQIIKKHHARFDLDRFKLNVIKISMDYIAKELVRAEKEDIPLRTALSVALNIENAIVDGEVFESFKGYTAEAKRYIRECAANFAEHYRAIKDMWSTHRKVF